MNGNSICHNRFAKYWNKAKSTTQVAKHFGITTKSAIARAKTCRAKGMQLKRFRNPVMLIEMDKNYTASPTFFAPGSSEKIELLRERATHGSDLWIDEDATPETAINRVPTSEAAKRRDYEPRTAPFRESRKWINEDC